MEKIKKLLLDKSGTFSPFEILFGFSMVILVLFMGISFFGEFNKVLLLDRFADELVSCASLYGRCAGDEIEERYSELVKSTGLQPEVEYEAVYVNSYDKKVQYGNSITVNLTLHSNASPWKGYSVPMTYTRKSTGQSHEYWKE